MDTSPFGISDCTAGADCTSLSNMMTILPRVRHKLLRCLGERRRALAVQLHVHGIVGGRVLTLADGHVRDVRAGNKRRVSAVLHLEVLGLARGQLVAQLVGDGGLVAVLAVLYLGLHVLVGERVEARELQLAGLADGVERVLGVREAGDLHEDLVGALHLHHGLRGAERVHAALDDGAALFHVLGRHGLAALALRREHDRQAALDVQALVDLLLRGREHEDRSHHQQGGGYEEPDVAPVDRAAGLLLRFLGCRHGGLSLVDSFHSKARGTAPPRQLSYCATNRPQGTLPCGSVLLSRKYSALSGTGPRADPA